jgi:predicted TIM-barrel fold metal-dependent hydrolase
MTQTVIDTPEAVSETTPLVIVSSDTHIGPLLEEQLREYCPAEHLEAFDAFATEVSAVHSMLRAAMEANPSFARNQRTEGHFDPQARIRDLNYDGVAVEVIFHGSQNGQPIPFEPFGAFLGDFRNADFGMLGIGYRIYNRWLADFVSVEPERHVGLAHLPMWDVDAAVAELRWAREAGLRGVNFPAPKLHIEPYNNPVWEPFWAACDELGMTLCNHGGAGNPSGVGHPGAAEIQTSELSTLSHVAPMNQLIFGGVFERHPGVRLVLTELPGTWWPYVFNELDSIHLLHRDIYGPELLERVPRLPSEYGATNIFIGASFLARFEAAHAVDEGYASNVIWGSDYPHAEGTFQMPAEWDEEPLTRVAMRHTFAGLGASDVADMLGRNAVRAYGLDPDAIGAVATRIGAPSYRDIDRPVSDIPSDGGRLAFRQVGPWA